MTFRSAVSPHLHILFIFAIMEKLQNTVQEEQSV